MRVGSGTSPDNPEIAVLLFSMHEEDDAVMEAVLAGARGYVVKGVRQEQLLRAIRTCRSRRATRHPGPPVLRNVDLRLAVHGLVLAETAVTVVIHPGAAVKEVRPVVAGDVVSSSSSTTTILVVPDQSVEQV